jgi:choline-sulfatase
MTAKICHHGVGDILLVPQDILDLYAVGDMPAPRLHPKDGQLCHPRLEACHRMAPTTGSTTRRRRLAMACYFGLCTWVDCQVGWVVRAIERNGLSETTRVAYSSNHGGNVGARGMSGKSTRYDVAAGVPLIPAGPHVP